MVMLKAAPERIVSKDEQRALCELAKAGDRDAANRLALAVWPWVRRKAGIYARRYHVEPDELEAVGLSRFSYAVRSYDPAGGSFLNFFGSCAAREMMALVRDEEARRRREEASDEAVAWAPQPESLAGEDDDRVRAELASLDPVSRELLELMEGVNGEPMGPRAAGRRLGLSYASAKRRHEAAFNRLSDRLAPIMAG